MTSQGVGSRSAGVAASDLISARACRDHSSPEPTDNEENIKSHLKKSTWWDYCDAFTKRVSFHRRSLNV